MIIFPPSYGAIDLAQDVEPYFGPEQDGRSGVTVFSEPYQGRAPVGVPFGLLEVTKGGDPGVGLALDPPGRVFHIAPVPAGAGLGAPACVWVDVGEVMDGLAFSALAFAPGGPALANVVCHRNLWQERQNECGSRFSGSVQCSPRSCQHSLASCRSCDMALFCACRATCICR